MDGGQENNGVGGIAYAVIQEGDAYCIVRQDHSGSTSTKARQNKLGEGPRRALSRAMTKQPKSETKQTDASMRRWGEAYGGMRFLCSATGGETMEEKRHGEQGTT